MGKLPRFTVERLHSIELESRTWSSDVADMGRWLRQLAQENHRLRVRNEKLKKELDEAHGRC